MDYINKHTGISKVLCICKVMSLCSKLFHFHPLKKKVIRLYLVTTEKCSKFEYVSVIKTDPCAQGGKDFATNQSQLVFELKYMEDGRQHFPSNVLRCPVKLHEQQSGKMCLAGFICLKGSVCWSLPSVVSSCCVRRKLASGRDD